MATLDLREAFIRVLLKQDEQTPEEMQSEPENAQSKPESADSAQGEQGVSDNSIEESESELENGEAEFVFELINGYIEDCPNELGYYNERRIAQYCDEEGHMITYIIGRRIPLNKIQEYDGKNVHVSLIKKDGSGTLYHNVEGLTGMHKINCSQRRLDGIDSDGYYEFKSIDRTIEVFEIIE